MPSHSPKITVFYSPQGGSGKSTLALNTSIFSAISGIRTLLIDMSVYGSITSALKIPHKGSCGLSSVITLLDLNMDKKESTKIVDALQQSVIGSDVNENLDILPSANPIRMEAIDGQYTGMMIHAAGLLKYDQIIIDTSSELSEKNLVLMDMADSVIIPVIQDISCGWKMVMFKEVIDKYLKDTAKVKMVVNQCSKYSGFNNKEFEREIGYPVIGEIPLYAKNYQSYINQGRRIDTMYNKKAYKAYKNIAQKIVHSLQSESAV